MAEAAKVVKEAEARRKQEERRARKEAKEAETAAILAMRQAAKEYSFAVENGVHLIERI